MCSEASLTLDPTTVPRLRAQLALIRSLVDELERHVARETRGGIDLDWAQPVADQLADEAVGLSKLVKRLPDSSFPPAAR